MMGIGNLTELTDVDSAGVNTLLIGFCQELAIRSVLTTEVINWARSSVREIDLARRLAHHAVTRHVLPKHVEPRLVMLRDPKARRHGAEALASLARSIKDPNWRIFVEDGAIHVMNNAMHIADTDPFSLFDKMGVDDPSHAFYLGYELMKARTALTLNKEYRQDRALSWGFLTEPEIRHRERTGRAARGGKAESEARRDPRRAGHDARPGRHPERRPDGSAGRGRLVAVRPSPVSDIDDLSQPEESRRGGAPRHR